MESLDDLDALALRKKPKPIGWFAAGAVVIAGAGFVFAYYMPLRQAQAELTSRHEALAQKSHELDATLKKTRAELDKLTDEHGSLSREVTGEKDKERTRQAELDGAKSATEQALAPFAKSSGATYRVGAHGVHVTFPAATFFKSPAKVPLPRAVGIVCAAAKGLGVSPTSSLRIALDADGGDDAARKGAAEQAAGLAGLAATRCKIAPERVVFEVRRPADGAELHTELTIVVPAKGS